MIKLIISVVVCYLILCVLGQAQVKQPDLQESSIISFAEHDIQVQLDDSKKNAKNRIPLYKPSECKENELYYPGDQKDDWVCDCLPYNVYYPATDQCYQVYTKGPCEDKQYLILPTGKNIPECVPNKCQLDNKVFFRGGCHTLNSAGPCRSPELSYVVAVNITTLALGCIKQSAILPSIVIPITENRFGEEKLPEKIPVCAKGSHRAINGVCTPSVQLYDIPHT